MGIMDAVGKTIMNGAQGTFGGVSDAIPGVREAKDKAWNLPGVKQVTSFTGADMAADPTHYNKRAVAEGKSGGQILGDAVGLAATAVGGAGAAAKGASMLSKAGKVGQAAEGASGGGKLMQAAKKAPTFLSGRQFGASQGGGDSGGGQGYSDPLIGQSVTH
jgi:hypothetical protein